MIKTSLSASLVVALLCAPALAQPAPTSPPRPQPPRAAPSRPAKLVLAIQLGNDRRTYELLVEDGRCGNVSAHDLDRHDEIGVCTEAKPNGLWINAQWKLRAGALGYETNWSAVVARGQTIEVGRAGGARFTLSLP